MEIILVFNSCLDEKHGNPSNSIIKDEEL
jgi:hypothetical protein